MLDTTAIDTNTIDSISAYIGTLTPVYLQQTTTMVYTKPHNRKWDPKDFIYTYGSQIKGNTTLVTGVVNPRTHTISHVEVKS